MSNRTLAIDDRIYEYMLSVSLREPALQKQLREETAQIEYSGMQIAPEQGQFMTLIVRLLGVTRALEVGTFTGYSSISIALGMPAHGRLVCCDDNEEWTAMARKYWKLNELEDRIELKLGNGVDTMQSMIDSGESGSYDFVFLDADKQNYPRYYEQALDLLRDGGLLLVDNTLWGGEAANAANTDPGTRAIRRFNTRVRDDDRIDLSLVPIGDGLSFIRKKSRAGAPC